MAKTTKTKIEIKGMDNFLKGASDKMGAENEKEIEEARYERIKTEFANRTLGFIDSELERVRANMKGLDVLSEEYEKYVDLYGKLYSITRAYY